MTSPRSDQLAEAIAEMSKALEQDVVQRAKDLNHLIMEFYDETDKINGEIAELQQQAMEAGESIQ